MKESIMIIYPMLFTMAAGIGLLILPEIKERKYLSLYVKVALFFTAVLVLMNIMDGQGQFTLFAITKELVLYFQPDELGKLFACIVTIVWVLVGFYALSYMKKEPLGEKRFFGFYLILFGILLGINFAGNLFTMYLFYELLTLLSIPLVIHVLTKEAIMAGLKYAFYSFCGAYMALFGFYILTKFTNNLTFRQGGVIDASLVGDQVPLLLAAVFIMILGFGVKAGMFPMHGWLPTAHPVAPAPASAVMSGVIVKMGIFAVIRVVYYLVGTEWLIGTWVQQVWLILTLLTVFMGSMLAFKEPVLKKRLAYSTVSQLSYILFGVALMNPVGMTGALLHVVFHALIKSALFLTAGYIIFQTGNHRVEQMEGIGKKMPVLLWGYTFLALALVGIPPTGGFVSKWYLATGSLQSGIPVLNWLGPVVLLVSALLTAGYLLPLSLRGFLPKNALTEEETVQKDKQKAVFGMMVPIMIMTVLVVLLGCFPQILIGYITDFAGGI